MSFVHHIAGNEHRLGKSAFALPYLALVLSVQRATSPVTVLLGGDGIISTDALSQERRGAKVAVPP